MSKFILGFNWKMNPQTQQEANQLFLNYNQEKTKSLSIVAVPAVFLSEICNLKNTKNIPVELAVQDISAKDSGAVTGEISASMVKDSVKYVVIGHSETRLLHNLSNKDINLKVIQSIKNSLNPILCIGFSSSSDIDYKELKEQIVEGLANTSDLASGVESIIIAYEPVWAIGTGKTATPEIIATVNQFIYDQIEQNYPDLVDKLKILYGGSVNAKNSQELAGTDKLNGFLIGGSSLKAEEVQALMNQDFFDKN